MAFTLWPDEGVTTGEYFVRFLRSSNEQMDEYRGLFVKKFHCKEK